MDYLIQFLFSNIIPIIIVVSIVLRVYGGMKKAAESRRGKTTRTQGWVQEREDTEEDATAPEEVRVSDDDIQPRFYLAESDPPRQIIRPPSPSLVPLPEIKPLDSAASRPIFETAAPAPFQSESFQAEARPVLRQVPPVESASSSAFLRRISALRPMQQALVLSEILGPPRGMEP